MTARVLLAATLSLALRARAEAAAPLVLTNHLGYEPTGPKRAVVQGHAGDAVRACRVEHDESGRTVARAAPRPVRRVAAWRDWVYWSVDFSWIAIQAMPDQMPA